jgi:N-acetyl-anhydromuramyl-L-alanine amidase AmpD
MSRARALAKAATAACLCAAALLSGCAVGPRIDTSYAAVSQGSRVETLIIHYTALDFPTSLRVLTQQAVSSHYLVDVDPPTISRPPSTGWWRRASAPTTPG